jgi:GrpB-like predicted nucleotidyltransferase (UPF0157 family)
MPAPIPVELRPYTPEWDRAAAREAERLSGALGENLIAVHHIGSTAIPGIIAKPILDLLPVVGNLSLLDDSREALEAIGYEWWGEYGLAGRRYCTCEDPATGRRKVQLHCYREGSAEMGLKATRKTRKLLIPLDSKNAESAQPRYTAVHRLT